MARARNIKPAFFTNELLGTYDPIISLLFAGLWCLADREGILEDRPVRIKGELFPYRDGLDINGYLTVLERDAFLTRYEVDGVKYIAINNFTKHQSPHHTEKAKGYPKPDQEDQAVSGKGVPTPLTNGECEVPTRSDLLIPDSLTHDSGGSAKPSAFSPKAHLVGLGVDARIASDFLAIRKAQRKPLTETAINAIVREADKASWPVEQAIKLCCERGWQSFQAKYVENEKPAAQVATVDADAVRTNRASQLAASRKAYGEKMAREAVRPVRSEA